MAGKYRNISVRGWTKLASWTVFGTLGCVAVALIFNYAAFRGLGTDALRQGLITAIIIPIILAGPLFFYLTLKLRELAIVNHKLNQLASTDGLTGCLNRGAFAALVEGSLDALRRVPDAPGGALLVVDADHFKAINDRFGHDRGDEALRLIALSIRAALRSGDAVGRLGGEEFGIYLQDVDRQGAFDVAERIRQAVASADFAPGGKAHPLTVSVGCVVYDEPTGFRDLFSIADERLYAAKNSGRNRVMVDTAPPLAPELDSFLEAG